MTHSVPPLPSKIAAIVIGFFSLGPFATALDLLTPVLPNHPAIEVMRSGSLLLKLVWIASGLLGIAAFILLMKRRFSGFVLTLPFAAASLIGGNLLWQQPRPVAVVSIVLACVLAGFGARQARADDAVATDLARDARRFARGKAPRYFAEWRRFLLRIPIIVIANIEGWPDRMPASGEAMIS